MKLLNKKTIASLNANNMRKIIGAADREISREAAYCTIQTNTTTSEVTKPNNAVSNHGSCRTSYDDAPGFTG